MSEDLQYNSQPPISANEGWQQMQSLLNAHLPVQKQPAKRFFYTVAAVLVLMFLGTFLQLDNSRFNALVTHKTLAENKETAEALTKPPALFADNKKIYLKPQAKKPFANTTKTAQKHVNLQPNSGKTEEIDTTNTIQKTTATTKETFENNTKEPITRETISTADTLNINLISAPVKATSTKTTTKTSWNFAAGLAVNATLLNSQNLQLYPVAEVKFNINPRFYVSAAVAPFSPVGNQTSGISKTVYLNDTLRNIRMYNETSTYHHLYYVDVPLSFGVNVTKNLSVQAGLQTSVLVIQQKKQVLEPYDFQMNNLIVPGQSAFAARPNVQQQYDVKVRNIDYRFISGVRYAIKKTSFGVNYQHGLQAIGKGANILNHTNQVIAFQVLYRLK